MARTRTTKTSDGRKPGKRPRYWSKHVMETSDALDLEDQVFQSRSPRTIAASLKKSALASKRRKGTPLQSAMSMLNFYINRAGRNLPAGRKRVLEQAKEALREAFGRTPTTKRSTASSAKSKRSRRAKRSRSIRKK